MSSDLLLITLDSCDAQLVAEWADAGELPTFGQLFATCQRREVINAPGFFGGTVWPSFATGLSPAGHGRFCALQASRGAYDSCKFGSSDIAGRQFWERLSDAGRRVAVIDVPMSRPSPRLNGIQLVDFLSHDGFFHPPIATPPELYDEIASMFGPGGRDTCDEQWSELDSAEGAAAFTDHLLQRARIKGRLCEHYLRREHWHLFIASLNESHCVGHQFWHLHDATHPRHRRDVAAASGDPLLILYRALDEQIAALLDAAGSGAGVMVWLTHGMGSAINDYTVVLDEILCRLDTATGQRASGAFRNMKSSWYRLPGELRQMRAARALKKAVIPALRQSLLIPQRRSRRFFAIPADTSTGAVRINCIGREEAGLVARGAEYRAVLADIAAALAEIVDPRTGVPAVLATHFPRDLYAGPHLDALPDLLVEWNHDHRFTALQSPRLGVLPIPELIGRSGEHRNRGLLLDRANDGSARPLPVEGLASLICGRLGLSAAQIEA